MFLCFHIFQLFVVANVIRSEPNLATAFQSDSIHSGENIKGKLKDASELPNANYAFPIHFNMQASEIKRLKRGTNETIIKSESNTEDISGVKENQQMLLTKRNLRLLTNMTTKLFEYFTVLEEKMVQNQKDANSTNTVLIQLKEHELNHQSETNATNSMMLQMNSTLKGWADTMKTKDATLLEFYKKENNKLLTELEKKNEIHENDSLNSTIEEMKEEIRLLKINNQKILKDTKDSLIQIETHHSEAMNKLLKLIMLQHNTETNQIPALLETNNSNPNIDMILAAVKNQTEMSEQKMSVHQFLETMKNISNLQKTVDELKRSIVEKNATSADVLKLNVTTGEPQTLTSLNGVQEIQTNENVKKRENLLKYLGGITGNKTISGLFVYYVSTNSTKGVQILNRIDEKSPGIISTNIPSYKSNVTMWNSFVSDVISLWNQRYLVRIVWRWSNHHPLFSINIFTNTSNANEVEKRWIDLITDGGHLNQEWKTHLDLLAPYLHQLQTTGVIAILDILPIINNKFGIWSGRQGINGTAKLFKITHDYLTKHHNLTSFIWTWSLSSRYLSEIEKFWPGKEYVDVASVIMWETEELPINEYNKLVEVAGELPLSMDLIYTFPTSQLLAAQPRWTWFTADDTELETGYNNNDNIKTVLNSIYVINKENVAFFNNTN